MTDRTVIGQFIFLENVFTTFDLRVRTFKNWHLNPSRWRQNTYLLLWLTGYFSINPNQFSILKTNLCKCQKEFFEYQ